MGVTERFPCHRRAFQGPREGRASVTLTFRFSMGT